MCLYTTYQAGASAEARDVDADTPLIAACNKGNAEIGRVLVAAGCDVNAVGFEGWTALHRAVLRGSRDLVTLLLEGGASVEASNDEGDTPIHVACGGGTVVGTLAHVAGGW